MTIHRKVPFLSCSSSYYCRCTELQKAAKCFIKLAKLLVGGCCGIPAGFAWRTLESQGLGHISTKSIQYSRSSATGLNASRDRICIPRKIFFEKWTRVRRVFSCYFGITGELDCTLSCSWKSISLFDGKLLVNNLFRVLQNDDGLRTTFCYLLINKQIWTLIQSPEKSN